MTPRDVIATLFGSLANGEWLEAVGKVILWRFLLPDGASEDWVMDFRTLIQVTQCPADIVPPNAIVTLDLGAAVHLLSADATADDLYVAVKANLITVTGDHDLVLRLASAALRQG